MDIHRLLTQICRGAGFLRLEQGQIRHIDGAFRRAVHLRRDGGEVRADGDVIDEPRRDDLLQRLDLLIGWFGETRLVSWDETGAAIRAGDFGELTAQLGGFLEGLAAEEHLLAEGVGLGRRGVAVGADGGEVLETVGGVVVFAEEAVDSRVGLVTLFLGGFFETVCICVGIVVVVVAGGGGRVDLVLGHEQIPNCQCSNERNDIRHAAVLVADVHHLAEPRGQRVRRETVTHRRDLAVGCEGTQVLQQLLGLG